RRPRRRAGDRDAGGAAGLPGPHRREPAHRPGHAARTAGGHALAGDRHAVVRLETAPVPVGAGAVPRAQRSNSPLFVASTNVDHSVRSKTSMPLSGALESRTATTVSRLATSTQLPPVP